jgi:hypothetical protein
MLAERQWQKWLTVNILSNYYIFAVVALKKYYYNSNTIDILGHKCVFGHPQNSF